KIRPADLAPGAADRSPHCTRRDEDRQLTRRVSGRQIQDVRQEVTISHTFLWKPCRQLPTTGCSGKAFFASRRLGGGPRMSRFIFRAFGGRGCVTRLRRVGAVLAVACLLTHLLHVARAADAVAPAETALDRYIARPDPEFAWKVVATKPGEGYTAFVLELT